MPSSSLKPLTLLLALLLGFVTQGAELPGHDLWSLKPIARPPVPKISDQGNPIDAFIQERLQRDGLTPSPPAERALLVRRLSYDLLGLPPDPVEVATFVADVAPDAWSRLVERMLASPRYGEKWARHWLDVVRYAETHGFEMNQPRPNAWPFRDYVIGAFNSDEPYDRFILEQLAGDRMGNDAATGFLVAGPWDQVKSPDEVLTRNQRADELHDIVATTSSAFLGVTVGCARCHNHKFDPIPQTDYYAIKAIFEGVQHGERTLREPDYERRVRRAAEIRKELDPIREQLSKLQPPVSTNRFVWLDAANQNQFVTFLRPPVGREPYRNGKSRGEAADPGTLERLPTVGSGYHYWKCTPGEEVAAWTPKTTGSFQMWLSWGAGWKTHSTNAQFLIDADGNLETKDDRKVIATVDQRKFADGSGDMSGSPLWSGFYSAGLHSLRPNSKILLRAGSDGAFATTGTILLEENAGSQPAQPNLRVAPSARLNVERFPPVQARFLRFSIQNTSGSEACIDELEVFANQKNVAAATSGAKLTSSGNYRGNNSHKLEHINDGQYGNEKSWIPSTAKDAWVQIEFAGEFSIDKVQWSRDRTSPPKFSDRIASEYDISVSVDGTNWKRVASHLDRIPYSKNRDGSAWIGPLAAAGSSGSEAKTLLRRKTELEDKLSRLEGSARVYSGEFKKPEPTFRLNRGDPMQPREPIQPNALSQLSENIGKLELSSEAPEQERRLAFARWIVSTNNPLTARVIVNRLWQQHFGEGLVSTPSDFGMNGARPSHPELLDWLAAELMQPTGATPWSLKHIQRLILTSATYQQSSTSRPESIEKDADSRLLWRFPPQRLQAEGIRDAMLAVAGQLELKMGGPGWSAFEPNENYVRVYVPKQKFGPGDFRRMIYATAVRQRPDGVFGVFDCPDGGQIAPKRARSTTPLQALNLLNSGFIMQTSEAFAERLQTERPNDAASQISLAYELAFSRSPAPEELAASSKFAKEHGLPLLCRALLNANEFIYIY